MALERGATEPETKTWDPGGSVPYGGGGVGTFKIKPNEHLRKCLISSALVSSNVIGDDDDDDDERRNSDSRTDLDTHANMPVVGRNVLIIQETGETVDVHPFSPDYPALKAKLVDAAVRYDCPHTGIAYLLIIRNAIYVPSMKNNLIPPFIMREAGIRVNDVPKIQMKEPTIDDQSFLRKLNFGSR